MRQRLRTWPALLLVLVSTVLVAGQLPALAAGTAQALMPVQVPGKTPQILDGTAPDGNGYRVLDMKLVGNRIVVAGIFAQVQNPGTNGVVYPRSSVFAFDPASGLVDPNFAPAVTGQVNAVAAGPNNTVFLGGQFSQVNGVGPPRLALVNLSNGSRVAGFSVPTINSAVQDISVSLATNRVYIAGTFSTVKAAAHGGLASLDATTGALDPYMSLDVAGHHNYLMSGRTTGAQAPVGVTNIDISPDGSRMIAIGNFTSVEGVARDQVASIQLSATSPAVDAWQTQRYTPACKWSAFDSYVRGVQWAPDGSYFVIVATGAYNAGTLCDAAAKFNASDTVYPVQPAWVSYTGGDSLWSVAITGTAVYVGGHQRWGNNPFAGDKAGPGAVPRPGLTALDPLNGVPLSWNPGRNPRGIGAEALLATDTGLYVGMDTNWIGDFDYQRKKLAYFPLLNGTTPPSQDTGTLANGAVYLAGATGVDSVRKRTFDGSTASIDSSAPSGGVPWSQARGAFMAGNMLYYGFPDSTGTTWEMARQTFDGSTFGNQQILSTPYQDLKWHNVATGSGTSTYDGVFPNFYGAELKSVTGMFYWNGRLYYAKSGSNALLYRGFSVDSGIVSADSFTVPGSTGFSSAGGMFIDGGFLYVVNRTTGALSKMTFANGVLGAPTPVGDGKDWRANAVFIGPSGIAPANQPPTAAFATPPSCTGRTCTFDGSTSSDPENGPLTYAWNFGDGTTGTGAMPTAHTYSGDATYTVTLTVTDDHNQTGSISHTVTVAAPAQGVAFKATASNSTPGGATSISLNYPSVAVGDGLVLILSNNGGSPPTSTGVTGTPPGFTQVRSQTALVGGTNTNVVMTTQVFQRAATGGETGTLTVPLSGSAKATLQLLVYSGTAAAGPVRTATSSKDETAGTSHSTPVVAANAGDWVVSVWSDKSSSSRTWTGPTTETVRTNLGSTGLPSEIATLVEDAGQPVATTGDVAGLTATVPAGTPSSKATMFSIVLAPA